MLEYNPNKVQQRANTSKLSKSESDSLSYPNQKFSSKFHTNIIINNHPSTLDKADKIEEKETIEALVIIMK